MNQRVFNSWLQAGVNVFFSMWASANHGVFLRTSQRDFFPCGQVHLVVFFSMWAGTSQRVGHGGTGEVQFPAARLLPWGPWCPLRL